MKNCLEDISVEELAELLFVMFAPDDEPEKFSMAMRAARLYAHNLKALTSEDPRAVAIIGIFSRIRELDESSHSDVAEYVEKAGELLEKFNALAIDAGMSSIRILAEQRQRRIASLKSGSLHKVKTGAVWAEMGTDLDTWLGQAIREANESADAERVKLLLRYLLVNIGVPIPIPGVLVPMSEQESPGRPVGGTRERQKLFDLWVKLRFCPVPELAEVAYEEIYGEQFIRNPQNGKQKKERSEQIKRCRTALLREGNAYIEECQATFEELQPENTAAKNRAAESKKALLTILKQGR